MAHEIVQLFIQPLVELWQSIMFIVPNILASLIFLLVGLTLSRAASTLLGKGLGKVKLDDYTSKIGINEIFARVGFGKSPAYAISFVIYWSIMLVFIILAANTLNLSVITTLLERFMYFIPKLVVSILIVFGGLLFARFVHEVVANSAAANNLKGGIIFAKAIHAVIIIFAALMALEQLGMAMFLITSAVQIILASLGVAFALALGLGAKDIVAEFLRNSVKKGE